ncbi:MAG: hypothetical protein HY754_04385 [Nitrospirae bacterium]|nr:hypothetical protein [Nitrospirota bacterium]
MIEISFREYWREYIVLFFSVVCFELAVLFLFARVYGWVRAVRECFFEKKNRNMKAVFFLFISFVLFLFVSVVYAAAPNAPGDPNAEINANLVIIQNQLTVIQGQLDQIVSAMGASGAVDWNKTMSFVTGLLTSMAVVSAIKMRF